MLVCNNFLSPHLNFSILVLGQCWARVIPVHVNQCLVPRVMLSSQHADISDQQDCNFEITVAFKPLEAKAQVKELVGDEV